MKRVFISQPMAGRSDDEILTERASILDHLEKRFGTRCISATHSFILEDPPNDVNSGLWYRARSIDALSKSDWAYFAPRWEEYRGCQIEHECAEKYGIDIIHDV